MAPQRGTGRQEVRRLMFSTAARASLPAVLALLALVAAPVAAAGESADLGTRARTFLDGLDVRLAELEYRSSLAAWTYQTNISSDNAEALVVEQLAFQQWAVPIVKRAEALLEEARRGGQGLDSASLRELELVRVELGGSDLSEEKQKEMAELASEMEGIYGAQRVCSADGTRCQTLEELERIMASSTDYGALLQAWRGWRDAVGPRERPLFERLVALANEGARAGGFADAGAAWRSAYAPLSEADVRHEAERLWGQVRGLYTDLHCVVRDRLSRAYGPSRVDPAGHIPAHLLGNMWSQNWSPIFPLVAPFPNASADDLSARLAAQGYTPARMYRLAESFFTSLGLQPLPEAFWTSSMLERPKDGREVVCHASAWDMISPGRPLDVRIKACAAPTAEDFFVASHELGHCYYFLNYANLRAMHRQGAHDGFHEAIGDVIRLSASVPSRLAALGLGAPPSGSQEATVNAQMLLGLEKIAFVPFALALDLWRWRVFSGETPPDRYSADWWALRRKYQGVGPAVERADPGAFDAGAKYHVVASVPYVRYLFALVLQFQIHAALCASAGHRGPLHLCSIFNSSEAGTRLRAALAMGRSRPWPDVLEALVGHRHHDAGPLLEYFAPLAAYLKGQIAARRLSCSWPNADTSAKGTAAVATGSDYGEEARRSVGQVAAIAGGCFLGGAFLSLCVVVAVRCARARRPRRYTAALQAEPADGIEIPLRPGDH